MFYHTSKIEIDRINRIIDGLPMDVDFSKFYVNGIPYVPSNSLSVSGTTQLPITTASSQL